MKIALYSFPNLAHGGGFEKYIMALAKELANRGHNVSIVTINRALQYKLEVLLSFFYFNPRVRFPDKFRLSQEDVKREIGKAHLYEVSSLKEMKKYINKADVIYSKNEILDLFMLCRIKDNNTLPIICGLHTALFYPVARSIYSKIHNFVYLSKLYEKSLNVCSGVHTVNPDQIEFVRKQYSSLNAKIFYVPYWIELPNQMRRTKQNSKFKILFLGRLTEQKGVDILAKIIKKLSKKPEFENMEFRITGSGELEHIIVRLSRTYSNVKYYGFVKPEQVSDLYLNSDICIVPSKWETVSYICLEAQSHGLPVVVSNISGPRGIIINSKTGFLVEPDDVEEFVNRNLELYHLKNDDFESFKIMGEEARSNIAERFSKKNIIPKLEAMFEEVVDGKR